MKKHKKIFSLLICAALLLTSTTISAANSKKITDTSKRIWTTLDGEVYANGYVTAEAEHSTTVQLTYNGTTKTDKNIGCGQVFATTGSFKFTKAAKAYAASYKMSCHLYYSFDL